MDYKEILDTGNVHEMRGEYVAICDKIEALQDEASFLIDRMQEICKHTSVAEIGKGVMIDEFHTHGICLICGKEDIITYNGESLLDRKNVVDRVEDRDTLFMIRRLDFDLVNKLTRRK